MKRQIVKIDEEKCTGCGLCVPACAEGAIKMVDGKARLIADNLCDGLGACLGDCPVDAITIEEREADSFDEKAVETHLKNMSRNVSGQNQSLNISISVDDRSPSTSGMQNTPSVGGCPSARTLQFSQAEDERPEARNARKSRLTQWPIQLHLVPPKAPFFENADILLTADCAPFAYADFHDDLLKGKALAIACPKLDDTTPYVDKLTAMIQQSKIKSITVVHMEVPCCNGLIFMAKQAIEKSGQDVPLKTICIGVDGRKK
ncbi:MAG: 4Fe-4S binding protein [Deltaproteobacteria bacterium]|jgi:NAD-dependent dihydropyrimidine dehydrogenase PreA subunit|nr:4Fe-4S binding protein [Deltaproteobacteria bacterium]